MKNIFLHQAVAVLFFTTTVALFTVSCNNSSPDSVKEAQKDNFKNTDSLDAKKSVTDSSVSVASKQDISFLDNAAAGGQLEVLLGQLAQTQASSQAVKDFGSMMIRDHGKGGEELKSLASAKQVYLPDSISNDQKKERDDLQKKKGKDFDKAYINLMVKDHKGDISEFKDAAGKANDPDVKAFAGKTLPMLQQHLDSAQAIEQRLKKG